MDNALVVRWGAFLRSKVLLGKNYNERRGQNHPILVDASWQPGEHEITAT